MSYFAHKEDAQPVLAPGHSSYELLTAANGCVNGCSAGISVYDTMTYQTPGCHDDQEGFVVLSGSGWAKIGEEEQRIEPGTVFIAPRGVPHCIKTVSETEPVTVFWFHAAI